MARSAKLYGLTAKPKSAFIFAATLTYLAGFLDVVGYVELNHLYVSFMSGNSTHLGMALSNFDMSAVLTVLCIISAFVSGVFSGTRIADHARERLLLDVSMAEALILLLSYCLAIVGQGYLALVAVAFAMGMQNSLHQTISGADMGRGFITGSLFNLGQSLARLRNDRSQAITALANLSVWICFVAGSCAGAFIYRRMGLSSALLLAVSFFIVTVVTALI
ncbi:DUF1275 domain-containing protein [Brucella sp. 21LCYQ03]|nr:DUF1275 domain-containing protein [Brucella sp. 21LCYQ03]